MKFENNWKSKSLQNLYKFSDSVEPVEETRLTGRCSQLLKTPIDEYTIEDLRLMVGQQFGLDYLIPFAIEKLNDDILAEGDFYPGDLLASVLKINFMFWDNNQSLLNELRTLLDAHKKEIEENGISLKAFETILNS